MNQKISLITLDVVLLTKTVMIDEVWIGKEPYNHAM